MSRTRNETDFARMLGRTGELLAPALLERLNVTDLEDLNRTHINHPWADVAGRLNGEWLLIAIRTRLNWCKPRRPGVAMTSYGFNGAGLRKANLASDIFRRSRGLGEDAPIRLLWLAIAVDLDNTYEAYWGDISEMRVIPRETGDDGLRIRMAPEDRARYTMEGRRLAWREPIEIHWNEFPDEWACAARKNYLALDGIADRERRIEEAVRMCSPCPGPRVAPHRTSDTLRPTPATLGNALAACKNADVAGFMKERLCDAGQGRIARALSYPCLNRTGAREIVGWYVTLFQERARVRQRGRFPGDESFWRTCLSDPASVYPLDGGGHLCFYLSTAADCRIFQSVMENVAPRLRLQPATVSGGA